MAEKLFTILAKSWLGLKLIKSSKALKALYSLVLAYKIFELIYLLKTLNFFYNSPITVENLSAYSTFIILYNYYNINNKSTILFNGYKRLFL